eukprot:gene8011-732_t
MGDQSEETKMADHSNKDEMKQVQPQHDLIDDSDSVKNQDSEDTSKEEASTSTLKSFQHRNKQGMLETVYTEPDWSRDPAAKFKLEVLKSGQIIDTIDISQKRFYIIGRLDACDIQAEHPSISRFHAVLQFADDGFLYVYDLNSTHGTKLNKTSVLPRRYFRVHIGHMLRFGASTRLYILSGPTELAAQENERLLKQEEAIRQHKETKTTNATREEKLDQMQGISWGMSDDVGEEEDQDDDTDAMAMVTSRILSQGGDFDVDAYYRKDPVKALRHFFSQMDDEMEFAYEQVQLGRAREFSASIELPVYDVVGNALTATGQGERKKDAMENCCLNACRILDAKKMLQKAASSVKSQTRSARTNDDDEDDEFYDRTGDVQRKRAKREHRLLQKQQMPVETAQTLATKHSNLEQQINELEDTIKNLETKNADDIDQDNNADEVDSYVKNLQAKSAKIQIRRLKKERDQLLIDLDQTKQLLKFVQPSLLL